jgi:hypothetical protein
MNFRVLANRSAEYLAELRDINVDMMGLLTRIRRPIVENQIDFYGDYVMNYGTEDNITIVPQYDRYYQVINILGQDYDAKLPLDAIVKVKDYIPNNSVILIAVRNNQGTTQSFWWRVLSTEVKHIESHYARVAHLAPTRGEPIGVCGCISIMSQSFVSMTSTLIRGFP